MSQAQPTAEERPTATVPEASATSSKTQLSPNAELIVSNVFRCQEGQVADSLSAEQRRRFYPVLRQWAEVGKAWRGKVFTKAEVEEAIAHTERCLAASGAASAASSAVAGAPGVTPSSTDCWWPRWVLNKARGVEVLAPSLQPGKPPIWTRATPVGIGYHGQKRRYLFVRTPRFEMDCRHREVRQPGGGRTVQELLQELLERGDHPVRHAGWTDGTDVVAEDPTQPVKVFVRPGVAPPSSKEAVTAAGDECGQGSVQSVSLGELEGEFERMALLRRSQVVKTRTCDHPDPLSEPRAAASIRLPRLTDADVLGIPAVVAEERLSSLQLETVTFAARRFRSSLPDGRTAGYVLGDGTGCGKGRVISALIYHMWNMGHRRSIWVSATSDLYYDACRDLQDLGADIPCVPLRRLPPSGPLDRKGSDARRELERNLGVECDGVIFLTYSLLVQTGQRRHVFALPIRTEESRKRLLGGDLLDDRLRVTKKTEIGDDKGTVELHAGDRVAAFKSLRELQTLEVPFTVSMERVLRNGGKDAQAEEKGGAKTNESGEYTPWNSRLGQLVSWLGGGKATGLICFDEVHKAKNLFPDKEESSSTKTGLFTDLLQVYCPKAPVLYVSATAATEVQHLGYMSRLGVWGPGTAFENFHSFAKSLDANGVAAMEMFAINMKAIGALSCRALAYVGTEFMTQQCGLTEEQVKIYNAASQLWRTLLQEYRKFANAKELQGAYRQKWKFKASKKKQEKGEDEALGQRIWQSFWGAQQRFFKAMCNSFKVPAACTAAKEAVDRGEQVVMSIWATGESRSAARMAQLKEETPGRVVLQSYSDGGLVKVTVKEEDVLAKIAGCLLKNMRLKADVAIGGVPVARNSRLDRVHGKRISSPEALTGTTLPVELLFRAPCTRRLSIDAQLAGSGEKVQFELCDDALGERVVVGKVLEGPPEFRLAEQQGWHVKTINDKPVGKLQVSKLRLRLRKGLSLAFQDAVMPDHLSGPQMILEHFLSSSLLTADENGVAIPWAVAAKAKMLAELRALTLPPNAMDELVDTLGGHRCVAEMSGRSHRMRRRKDGSLAFVARCEELKCSNDAVNLKEQQSFQNGSKKVCLVTEVASAGISLHSDRRQVRKGFQPPRRTMISVELPWGADKAIQVFGRVHRANQLIPPRFIMLTTSLGGEVRFISSIARRMKLLGAVTKGDRLTSMGGGADRHMAEFDVNNWYGVRALVALFQDTTRTQSAAPELLALYEALPFIGDAGEGGTATGRWPLWSDFVRDAAAAWHETQLMAEFEALIEQHKAALEKKKAMANTKESEGVARFLNRILMLDVELQNALYEAFFSIYTELVRIDQVNGEYDEGVENLNQYQGRTIREIDVAAREAWYKDPATGAETTYVRLRIDRGIAWQAAKEVYDALGPGNDNGVEGFYAFRKQPEAEPVYLLVKERQQLGGAGSSGTTLLARRRRKQYLLWHPCGVRTDISGGRQLYSAEDFTQDARFQRIGDTTADLEAVREGWQQIYDSSAETRLASEHILTGDVLSAWRLVACPEKKRPVNASSVPEEEGNFGGEDHAEAPKLQIVRAMTQPDGLPVVGMRVSEEDLPKLKYVLECKQAAAEDAERSRQKLAGEQAQRLDVRGIAFYAAGIFLERLAAAEGQSLPYASWLDLHRALAQEGCVDRSVDGLRGVQLAVERLQKAKLVIAGLGKMSLRTAAHGPDEDAAKGKGHDLPSGEELEALLFPDEFIAEEPADAQEAGSEEENDEEEPEEAASGPEEADEVAAEERGKVRRPAPSQQEASAKKPKLSTSAPATGSDPTDDKLKAGTVATPLRERQASAGRNGVRPREETSGDHANTVQQASIKRRRETQTLAEELFGDSDEDIAVKKSPPKAEIGHRWIYEVVGNKLGIRDVPDVSKATGTGYLKTGEFFSVTEKLLGDDGRTYLRLADGRGWAYDRSAKDINKVVVREHSAKEIGNKAEGC